MVETDFGKVGVAVLDRLEFSAFDTAVPFGVFLFVHVAPRSCFGFFFVLVVPKILRVVIDVKAVVAEFHVGYFFTTTQFFGYFLSVDTGKFFVFFEFVKERTIVAFRAFPYPF